MISDNLPNLRSAVLAWGMPTNVYIVHKWVHDNEIKETYRKKTCIIFQVPTGQNLDIKTEGQRAWNTETLYTDSALDLKVDDVIMLHNLVSQRYRVVNKTDWAKYGFFEYQVTQDYS